MRLVRRDGKFTLLRHRWKHGSAILVGGLMVTGACIFDRSQNIYWLSRSATLAPAEGTPALGSRRLGYPQDYVIGRWTEEGIETFDEVTVLDPKFPNQNKTVTEYVGAYKHAPIGRKLCIILHIFGVVYMLIGLNTVCDIYFCGALDEMVDKWEIPPDVAGATLMAAGGSAPELFTSIIGAVITESDVGFSTIVGSAVFNVLAVIGCCGMGAKVPIKLSWWPLFRDCTFYILSLSLLAFFASGSTYQGDQLGPDGQLCDPGDKTKKCGGGKINLYEAIILFVMYLIYITIAKFNEKLNNFFQGWIDKLKDGQSTNKVQPIQDAKDVLPNSTSTDALKVDHRASSATAKSEHKHRHHGDDDFIHGRDFRRAAHHAKLAIAIARNGLQGKTPHNSVKGSITGCVGLGTTPTGSSSELATEPDFPVQDMQREKSINETKEEETSSASSAATDDIIALVTVPEGDFKEKVQWALCLPVCVPMYYLIPRPEEKYLATFGISLLFIAFFSYWLVYFVQIFSDTILGGGNGVNVVMGFTLLAAGTSIPDLVSSMVVARAGEGDMAISSSIGSNIFDILVGLPIPWILKIGVVEMAIEGKSDYGVTINSPYIALYVILLLIMVSAVIGSILINNWKLNKTLGMMMALLYFVFLGIVIPLELFQYI